MNHLYKIFEFNVILEKVSTFAKTPMGTNKVLNLTHLDEIILIKENLAKVDEAMRIIVRYNPCPFDNIDDIAPFLIKAQKGINLTPLELYKIATLIEGGNKIKNFTSSFPFKDVPFFLDMVNELSVPNSLKKEILFCLTPSLEIADQASSTLAKVRKTIKSKENEIRSKLENILKKHADLLSDSIIATRNDRLVIPLKIQNKFALGGIVHDLSTSGQTAFVEPGSVVELNAALFVLRQQEKEEIDLILKRLTSRVFEESELLAHDLEIISELDFIFAKASYANYTSSQVATISEENTIILHKARHPLIDPKVVVANDFELKADKNMILITGPNTGGKTVALKTVGLLVLMNQAGLAIPVDGQAHLGIFKKIFADIGDEQSISSSLSTFSSHMKRIINIIDEVDRSSLVILDEIGGGTDPKEGEALAMAILQYLHQKEALTMCTTHYSNLKTFAFDSGYIINASMEFDQKELRPLYRLKLGIPGESYAFAISKRLGLNHEVIKLAQEYKNKYSTKQDLLLAKMEKELNQINEKEKRLKEKEEELTQKLLVQENLNLLAAEVNEKIKAKADEQINSLIEEAMENIDELLTKVRAKDLSVLKQNEVKEVKSALDELKPKPMILHEEVKDFNKGDTVFIKTLNKTGEVILKKGDSYVVNVDFVSLNVKASDLALAEIEVVTKKPKVAATSMRQGMKNVSSEINLVGYRVEEALNALDKYLDDALLVHLKQVRIIHGFGSGALRNGIHGYLKTKQFVKSYHLGLPNEGGSGSTIVILGD